MLKQKSNKIPLIVFFLFIFSFALIYVFSTSSSSYINYLFWLAPVASFSIYLYQLKQSKSLSEVFFSKYFLYSIIFFILFTFISRIFLLKPINATSRYDFVESFYSIVSYLLVMIFSLLLHKLKKNGKVVIFAILTGLLFLLVPITIIIDQISSKILLNMLNTVQSIHLQTGRFPKELPDSTFTTISDKIICSNLIYNYDPIITEDNLIEIICYPDLCAFSTHFNSSEELFEKLPSCGQPF